MLPAIDTARLRLRQLEPGDTDALHRRTPGAPRDIAR